MAKHSVEEVRAEYDRLDKLCGVDTSAIEIRVSQRSTSRYGYCHYRSEKIPGLKQTRMVPDYISITDFIFDCEAEFWNTIRHEYAHALVCLRDGYSHHHDKVWKAACGEVGCSPESCSSNREAANRSAARREEKAKYTLSCNRCGRKWTYVRDGRVVRAAKAGRRLTCPCGNTALIFKTI